MKTIITIIGLIILSILVIVLYVYLFIKVKRFLKEQQQLNERYVRSIEEKYAEFVSDQVNEE